MASDRTVPFMVSTLHRGDVSALDTIERAFLGICILEPTHRIVALDLEPSHFRSPARSRVWDVLRTMKHPDLNLLTLELERREIPPPDPSGWGPPLSALLDEAFPLDPEDTAVYVRAIKDAALERRMQARTHR